MCVIVDTCVFFRTFDPYATGHEGFACVRKWIYDKKGKLIIGGTKYAKELNSNRVRRLLAQLKTARKLVQLDDKKVDAYAKSLKEIEPAADFNDEHIVAMAAVSGCCVVCTIDEECMPYLKRKDFYPDGKRPKIYSQKDHSGFCRDSYIAPICR